MLGNLVNVHHGEALPDLHGEPVSGGFIAL